MRHSCVSGDSRIINIRGWKSTTCGVHCVRLGLRLPGDITAASGKKVAAILDAGRGEYRHSRNMGSH